MKAKDLNNSSKAGGVSLDRSKAGGVIRWFWTVRGPAFAKLQLHQSELLANEEKSVQHLVELLGGHWGKIGLEKQYEDAERALFNTHQLKDESNDSYLARSDASWSKLLTRKLTLKDLHAFTLLRGSNLSPEDKKKVDPGIR